MDLPVFDRRRIPKSQLDVMSTDWDRSHPWESPPPLSPREPGPPPPRPPLPGAELSWQRSRSTSWSISTISHMPVSSLVTWDCRIFSLLGPPFGIVGAYKKDERFMKAPWSCFDTSALSERYWHIVNR
ncbi:hypothetical protein JZ751_016722 [Albula glossodonta]|uniref:Uncharacterized protein n=1 Tax=Albula glossodonta TaxID=121402 RepID=A0A8T2NST8_9TELE|nr:hypothetical protein JZ751_016722 [Albula glossodonta]